jgi:hypothetical protein
LHSFWEQSIAVSDVAAQLLGSVSHQHPWLLIGVKEGATARIHLLCFLLLVLLLAAAADWGTGGAWRLANFEDGVHLPAGHTAAHCGWGVQKRRAEVPVRCGSEEVMLPACE